jgi:hypothetical protein
MAYDISLIRTEPLEVLVEDQAITWPGAQVKYSPATLGIISAKEPLRVDELMAVLAKDR